MGDFLENVDLGSLKDFLSFVVLNNSLWQWLLALIITIVFVFGSRFITRWLNTHLIGRYFKPDSVIQVFFDAIVRPLSVIVVWVGIRLAIGTLTIADSILDFVNSAYTILLTVLFAWLLSSVYMMFHERYLLTFLERSNNDIDPRLGPIIGGIIKGLIWVLAITIGISNAGYDIQAILAGLGIGGLAIALAGQDLIANVFGGLLIFLQRPFSTGNYIEVAGIRGWVQSIGFRTIQLQDFYGHMHHIPNRACADAVVNIDERTCYYVNGKLHLHFATTREQIQRLLERLQDAPKVDETIFQPKCWITLESIGQYYYCIDFWYAVEKLNEGDKPRFPGEYDKLSAGTSMINLEVMRILEENEIKLALPVQVLEVNNNQSESLFSQAMPATSG